MRACVDMVQGAALALVAEESEDKDKGVIESLLNFKDHWDALVLSGFHGNDAFVASVKSALEAAVNSRDNKPSELVGMCNSACMCVAYTFATVMLTPVCACA
ncbi:hypothetical protein EON64_05115, partial [archaeon]